MSKSCLGKETDGEEALENLEVRILNAIDVIAFNTYCPKDAYKLLAGDKEFNQIIAGIEGSFFERVIPHEETQLFAKNSSFTSYRMLYLEALSCSSSSSKYTLSS